MRNFFGVLTGAALGALFLPQETNTPVEPTVLVSLAADGSRAELREGKLVFFDKEGRSRMELGFLEPGMVGTRIFDEQGHRMYFDGLAGTATAVFRDAQGNGMNLGHFKEPGMFGVGYVYASQSGEC